MSCQQTYWDNRSAQYVNERRISATDHEALALLGLRPNDRILEIGCGPGVFAGHLLNSVPDGTVSYVGVDVSHRFLQVAKRNLRPADGQKLLLVQASLLDSFLQLRQFDAVCMMMVLHHFPLDESLKILKGIREMLREGGRFVLVEDWTHSSKSEFESLARVLRERLTKKDETIENHRYSNSWRSILQRAGFSVHREVQTFRPCIVQQFQHLSDAASREALQEIQRIPQELHLVGTTAFLATPSRGCPQA